MVICVVADAPAAGVTVAGLKLHVTPAGYPEQLNLTAELKPLYGATVSVIVPWLPESTVRKVGLAPRVKPGVMMMSAPETPLVP